MNTIRRLISALLRPLGLLALVALAVALAWLLASQGTTSGRPVSQVQTPTPPMDEEPTAPSEDWPTLTPFPTRLPPTPSGTKGIKPSPTPSPTPTRPPLLLTPIPEGQPPADLSGLYYVADTDAGPELRVIGMDAQGTRWSDSSVGINLKEPRGELHLSPDGKYLAGGGWGMDAEVYVVERSSGRVWCPLGEPTTCLGRFVHWTHDNRLLFQPQMDNSLKDIVLGGVLVVDIDTGKYSQLDLPTSPDGVYSYAYPVSLSPGDARIAYGLNYLENSKEVSEIWVMSIDGEDKHPVHKVDGIIHALAWSPTGEQLVYSYQPGATPASDDPSEIWILNSDGTDARWLADSYGEGHPVWSPDGRYVAFSQVEDLALYLSDGRDPGTNIYAIDTVTGATMRLSAFEGRRNTNPTWSPDSKHVAFVSTILAGEPEGYSPGLVYVEVWVASVDASQSYAVSGNTVWETTLSWLPVTFSLQEE